MGEGALFVYGTLKDPERVRSLLGRELEAKPAELVGWRLVPASHSGSGYPEIEPSPEGRVRGLLLLGVDAQALTALDDYEEGYIRKRVRVCVEQAWVEAEVYVPARWARAP